MVELFKLKNLPQKQKRRKCIRLLEGMERAIQEKTENELCDPFYARQLFSIIADDLSREKNQKLVGATVKRIRHWIEYPDEKTQLLLINHLRHELYRLTGAEPSDWDLLIPHKSEENTAKRTVFEGLYLFAEDIRSPFNLGSIFRTAESFGIEKIFISEYCVSPEHQRAQRSAMGCIETIPWERRALKDLPQDLPLLVLETGGTAIDDFDFPKKGILVIGSEELGVSPETLERADARLSIPMYGLKASLNVGVAFGICLQKWVEKAF